MFLRRTAADCHVPLQFEYFVGLASYLACQRGICCVAFEDRAYLDRFDGNGDCVTLPISYGEPRAKWEKTNAAKS